MSKGRRKVRTLAAPEEAAKPAVQVAPVVPAARKVPSGGRRGPGSRRLRVAVAVVLVAGLAFLVARWAWPASIEIRTPVGLENAAPEVREHVQSRIDRAREDPRNAERLGDLGIALAANGFWKDSRPVFEQAARLAPDDPLPAYYVARADVGVANHDSAKRVLEDLVERFPRFPQGRYALGSILLESGSFDAAADQFKAQVAIEGEASIWGRIGLANAMLKSGKPEQAVVLLEPVVEKEPGLPLANYLLGSAYRAVKKFDRANRHLAKGVLGSALTMPDAWTSRMDSEARTVSRRISAAQTHHSAGRLVEAIAILEALRKNHPDDLELLSNLGAFYADDRQPAKARDVLLHAHSVNSEHLPTIYNLVAVELKLGAAEAALKYARMALKLAPSHYHSHLAHADALSTLKRNGEALDAIRQAVRLDPRNASLRLRAGQLLIQLDRIAEAKTEFEAATGIDPANVEAWALLCEAAINLKLDSEARAAFDQASRLAPKAPQVQALARRINASGGR
jgi:tetratricopeptide (TPR) repeat protein